VQPIRAKFGIHGHIKGWQRSGNFGHDRPILEKNGGWDESRGGSFFCVVIQRTFWQLCNSWFSPNLVMKCSSVSRCGIRKDIFETFHFRGHLPPKSEVKKGSNRYLTQNSLQVRGCTAERYCLLCIVVQWPGSFQGMVNFSLWHTVVELGASKLPNFRILACFPHTNP